MPKRKRDDDDYNYFKKRLRKLKRKIKSGRKRHRDSSTSSSSSDNSPHHYPQECESIATVNDEVMDPEPGCSYWDDYWPEPDLSDVDCEYSCALSSLSKAITLLLVSDSKNQEVLKLLMDTVRILGDIQHSDSMLRRFFILSTVKKELKEQLEKTKIEDLLFGSNLVETLKSAKTINKTGADMRYSTQTTAKAGAPKPTKMSNKPLNSRRPPTSRRPAPSGGTRNWRSTIQAPTPRQATTKHHSSSRTSSRHPYPRHRR